MKIESRQRTSSFASFADGGCYTFLPPPELTKTNLFLKVARLDQVYLKLPSERGFGDYRQFIRLATSNTEDVRTLEENEKFSHLETTLRDFPALAPLTAISSELAHYLVVHKLQHERLRSQHFVKIPEVRFGAMQFKGWGFLRSYEPAMFQEAIPGTTLWNMFDFDALALKPEWRPFARNISDRLSGLLASGLITHIDWNIQNFVFDKASSDLYYVDLKPTTFVARHSNERNLDGIRRYYLL